MPLINCKNAVLSYDNKIVAQNISFCVHEGDFLCIVGENGSGKSTLLKAILGLIPIKSGCLEFLQGLKRQEIGYLPQQTEISESFPASVFEVVLSGMLEKKKMRVFYGKAEKKRAEEVLESLNISDLIRESFSVLSGGQKQRVLLARAICAAERVLVLDEPTANLDPLAASEFYRIIKEINTKENMTIIMVSHDIKAATENAQTILHISDKEMFFGSNRDYAASELGKRFCS